MKKNLYPFIRVAHTWSAFVLLGFLLMYFITGFMLSHEDQLSGGGPGAYKTITRLHRIHGYEGDLPHLLYALMMDLSSLALLLFVVTGFYMWLKLERKKAYGIALLLLACALTGGVIWSFMK